MLEFPLDVDDVPQEVIARTYMKRFKGIRINRY